MKFDTKIDHVKNARADFSSRQINTAGKYRAEYDNNMRLYQYNWLDKYPLFICL